MKTTDVFYFRRSEKYVQSNCDGSERHKVLRFKGSCETVINAVSAIGPGVGVDAQQLQAVKDAIPNNKSK